MGNIFVCESNTTDPYRNLAVEEWFTSNVDENDCILFLWQNRDTVVIGKNQDIYSECDIESMRRDNVLPARRLSGGGAVFHDTGNLNFSFCAGTSVYDVSRQTDVILNAVKSLGIKAVRTGRNDIEAGGAKFSGNAFLKKENGNCHHGTVLIETDPEKMMRYLTPDKEKLAKRSVSSVKARTVNLSSLKSDITPRIMKEAIIRAFQEEYQALKKTDLPCDPFGSEYDRKEAGEIQSLEKRFSSTEWIYGKETFFTHQYKKRFVFGGVDIRMQVEDGIIKTVKVFSDALDPDVDAEIEMRLLGQRYDRTVIDSIIEN